MGFKKAWYLHLADAFIQSDLQMRHITSNLSYKSQQYLQYCSGTFEKQLEGAQQIETDIIFINMKQLKNNAQTVKTMTSVCERTAIVMAGF